MIVDCAIYEQGVRQQAEPGKVEGVRDRKPSDDAFVWIGLLEPTAEEFAAVRREFNLHELAVEDAVEAHQRPKLELYGDTLFLVLKTVMYQGHEEVVDIGEVMVFAGEDFLITVRHGEGGGLGEVRERLERRPEILRHGPAAAMYAIVDRVVDAYEPAAAAITEDIEEVEGEVFSDDRKNPVQRIYKLRLEVVEFYRAAAPLMPALERLMTEELPNVPEKIRDYYRDVADHLAHVIEQLDSFRELLTSTLQANLTQVSVRQNEDMRRISAWVAIIAVPTAIAGIYGMNFKHMPELGWRFGYPLVLGVIAAACGYLYWRFRKSGWL
jgi:magnesium transporter